MIDRSESHSDEERPGKNIATALLLQEQNEFHQPVDRAEEEVLTAVTLILVRTPYGSLEAVPLSSTEYEGEDFALNMDLLHTVVTLAESDLQVNKTVRALAEVLTSRVE